MIIPLQAPLECVEGHRAVIAPDGKKKIRAETQSPAASGSGTSDPLTRKAVREIHFHLGHSPRLRILRMIKSAGYHVDETLVGNVLADFGCLKQSPQQAQRPRISMRQTLWGRHTVTMDVRYHIPETAQTHPYFAISGRFSRFAISGAFADRSPQEVVGFLFSDGWMFRQTCPIAVGYRHAFC